MSAHTVGATPVSSQVLPGGGKKLITTLTLSASYDSGGSAADFSTAGPLGAALGFQTVHGVCHVGFANGTTTNTKYIPKFIAAASYAAATGLIKIMDETQAADAEASGDLHTCVMLVEVHGT